MSTLSNYKPRIVQAQQRPYNVNIEENYGLNQRTGFWWLRFTFDYGLEKGIEVRLTNHKYGDRNDWTLEVVKCDFLNIQSKSSMASFDMVDEFINKQELRRLNESSANMEKLYDYLVTNVIPIVTKKIKYTKYKPQFRFFLSHKTKDKPLMRTFQSGLRFLGYDTWLDKTNMPLGADLQGALKSAIDGVDCLIAWLNKEYFESTYCKDELLYARKQGKIILPFGDYGKIKQFLIGELEFLNDMMIFDHTESSFFEILCRIDKSLFDFENLPI